MAIDSDTGIENHPDSTVAVNSIVNNNWAALNAILKPSTTSGDSRFALIWKALVRAAGLPTKAARAEFIPAQGKAVSRLVHDTLTYSGSLSVPTDGAMNLTCVCTGNPTITFTPMVEGREVTLILDPGASTRTVTWPVGIRWLSGSAPTSVPANKILQARFLCRGAAATDIVATFDQEP